MKLRTLKLGPITRRDGKPLVNPALHLSVVLGVGIQMLTIFLPGLRELLGLESLDESALVTVAAMILLGWGIAEVYVLLSHAVRRRQARNIDHQNE